MTSKATRGINLPDHLVTPRTDAIYNAHGYLTKVPVDAIVPYIEAFTSPGDTVADMFAGSGMTAIAARIAGRNAVVSDISVLGQHIAQGYLAEVDLRDLRSAADRIVGRVRAEKGDYYQTQRVRDGHSCEMIRTIWSFTYACPHCSRDIVYYHALEANGWCKPASCPHCQGPFDPCRSEYRGDVPVCVVVPGCDGKQAEQTAAGVDQEKIIRAKRDATLKRMPSVEIPSDREMYRRSALGKWNLEETRRFFSDRNAIMLTRLWEEIQKESNAGIRQKLAFAFTAILPRASRRYQWSHKRPLNANNQTYYISRVYFEWNVFDLFERKLSAVIRADDLIQERQFALFPSRQSYEVCSATSLTHLSDSSVDYVFTDPPFGSNIFYSDMTLFHEAWLGRTTDSEQEAVVHTCNHSANGAQERYRDILTQAFSEAHRVLKPGAYCSVIFGNSSGTMWSIFQKAIRDSGFDPIPAHVCVLDKGQRSVKGLNSGREGVATLDLIVTLRKPRDGQRRDRKNQFTYDDVISQVEHETDFNQFQSPSHIYLSLLKRAMQKGVSLEHLHLSDVLINLRQRGIVVDSQSGKLVRESRIAYRTRRDTKEGRR